MVSGVSAKEALGTHIRLGTAWHGVKLNKATKEVVKNTENFDILRPGIHFVYAPNCIGGR